MMVRLEIGGRFREASIERLGPENCFRFALDGRTLEVGAVRVAPGTWSLLLPGGGQHLAAVSGSAAAGFTVHLASGDLAVGVADRRRGRDRARAAAGAADGPARLLAPMAGRVVRVLVAAGQAVRAGQGVVVVEAMKMENELRAPRGGVIADVPVREGASVDAGAVLVVIE